MSPCPGTAIAPAPADLCDRNVWVGHELRTPLTVIIGYLRLLDALPGNELSRDQQEIVQTVESAAHRLEVLADLLTRAQDAATSGTR